MSINNLYVLFMSSQLLCFYYSFDLDRRHTYMHWIRFQLRINTCKEMENSIIHFFCFFNVEVRAKCLLCKLIFGHAKIPSNLSILEKYLRERLKRIVIELKHFAQIWTAGNSFWLAARKTNNSISYGTVYLLYVTIISKSFD